MTDKERLEDIKHEYDFLGLIHRPEQIKWLIQQAERVEELEKTAKKAMKAIDKTEAVRVKLINVEQQNKRYRKALTTISANLPFDSREHYVSLARQALEK